MRKGGIDGSNTQIGNKFKDKMFSKILENINKSYLIQESLNGISKQIIDGYRNITVGYIFTEQKFYNFFNAKKIFFRYLLFKIFYAIIIIN